METTYWPGSQPIDTSFNKALTSAIIAKRGVGSSAIHDLNSDIRSICESFWKNLKDLESGLRIILSDEDRENSNCIRKRLLEIIMVDMLNKNLA